MTLKECVNNTDNTNGWMDGWKNIERTAVVGFETWLVYEVFQSSLFLLFVTFDTLLGRYICLTGSCDFVIHE